MLTACFNCRIIHHILSGCYLTLSCFCRLHSMSTQVWCLDTVLSFAYKIGKKKVYAAIIMLQGPFLLEGKEWLAFFCVQHSWLLSLMYYAKQYRFIIFLWLNAHYVLFKTTKFLSCTGYATFVWNIYG